MAFDAIADTDAAASSVFADALRRAQLTRFAATDDLSEALGEFVHSLRVHGSTCEDAIVAVGAQARLVSPREAAPTEDGWEERWHHYFALYDRLIQQTVRAYVLDADTVDWASDSAYSRRQKRDY